jgi:hypothetical protein
LIVHVIIISHPFKIGYCFYAKHSFEAVSIK